MQLLNIMYSTIAQMDTFIQNLQNSFNTATPNTFKYTSSSATIAAVQIRFKEKLF